MEKNLRLRKMLLRIFVPRFIVGALGARVDVANGCLIQPILMEVQLL
jgi:hypothetical protein